MEDGVKLGIAMAAAYVALSKTLIKKNVLEAGDLDQALETVEQEVRLTDAGSQGALLISAIRKDLKR